MAINSVLDLEIEPMPLKWLGNPTCVEYHRQIGKQGPTSDISFSEISFIFFENGQGNISRNP